MTRYANQVVQQIAGVDVPVVGAKVYVYDLAGNLATLTNDAAAPLENPVTSDEYGNFYYNTGAGVYRHDYWYGGKLRYTDAVVMVGEGLPLPDSVLLALSATTGAALLGTASGLTLQQTINAFELNFTLLKGERVSVKDFGAVGTNYSDDTAAFAAAYAHARSVGGHVFIPTGLYGTTAEINTNEVKTVGVGVTFVIIKALAAIRSVFKINGQNNWLSGITVHGGDIALYCFYFEASNGSVIDNVIGQFAARDVVHWPASGNNNNTKVQNSLLRLCGKTWYSTPSAPTRGRLFQQITGTATMASGSSTITFTGAPDLTTLGLRPGADYVFLTGDDRARNIHSITATTIVTSPGVTQTATLTGVTFQLISGNVATVSKWGDNSVVKIINCTLQSAPGAGLRSAALYGALSQGNQFENLGYGIHQGIADGVTSSLGPRFVGDYFEYFGYKAVYMEQSDGAVVQPAQMIWSEVLTTSNVYNPRISFSFAGAQLTDRIVSVVGSPTIALDFGSELHFTYSSGAANPTFSLPNMSTAPSTPKKFSRVLRALFLSMGGKVYTITTVDGSTINGVAGATGVPFMGDYRELSARWNDDGGGWLVNVSGQDTAAATPAAGTWQRGRRFFYTTPSAGGKAGEVVTTAGVAGSTAVFKPGFALDA